MSTNVGIIGSGSVAKILGEGFIKYGYQVMLGTRDAGKLADWASGHSKEVAAVGSFADAAAFGDIIVLAVKGTAVLDVLSKIEAASLDGKTVIDATNPISGEPPENGVLKYFTSLEKSLMEKLQEAHLGAHFVKAFNIVGGAFMVDPDFESKPTMFICGNEPAAKAEVVDILDKFGWEVEDFGGVESARAIEPLCMLWCIPGMLEGKWSHAFKLLKK